MDSFPIPRVLVSVLSLSACSGTAPETAPETASREWGIARYSETDVVPGEGDYSFSQRGVFRVKGYSLQFSVDNYRYDDITVVNGAFYNTWGTADGATCPNCSCPTDGYGISGHFLTSTSAEGEIAYGSCFEAFPISSLPFIATLN